MRRRSSNHLDNSNIRHYTWEFWHGVIMFRWLWSGYGSCELIVLAVSVAFCKAT